MKKFCVFFLFLSNCFFASNQLLRDSLKKKNQAPLIIFSASYGFFNSQKKLVADYFSNDAVSSIGPIVGRLDFRIARKTLIGFNYGFTKYNITSYSTNTYLYGGINTSTIPNSGITVATFGGRLTQFFGINENSELYVAIGGGTASINNTVIPAYSYSVAPIKFATGYIEAVIGLYMKPSQILRINFEAGISRYCYLQTGFSLAFGK
jgi:hypothetical protein